MDISTQNETKEASDYQRCLSHAVARTRALLVSENGSSDYDEIHAVKSVLYAAIERAGMSAERMMLTQQKLRELFFLVTIRGDPKPEDRERAVRILEGLCKGSIKSQK